ncbi:GNAT family N-acetyltransferase [Paenibacillus donghaensis]|uniref:N-acetyltransferase domain-containing protein n=1 Tax=Paenibacillus donghaensis TaxID=414771 RepID=A0A2Z2KKC4_9BACL|nr:GNAT family N-acetyltransferase [Paenibacillus donghaensis]ASA23780.1 hypothetical protein B9T62_25155 [Paenibacillus donghaensis]
MEIKAMYSDDNQPLLSALLERHSAKKEPGIPPYDRTALSFAAYENGEYVGGVTGTIVWNMLQVQLLAVDPAYRGSGVGAVLLQTLEAKARQQGCKVSELTTMSWQAPGFYQKQGYEIFGEIKDCPHAGHTKYYLQKQL